jgi:DHA1 family inner membrane transport protein
VGFGGLFAVYTYIAKLTTEVTGLDARLVPLSLVVAGLGMTVGNLIGGRLADRGPLRAVFLTFGAFAVALVLLALTAANPVGLFAGLFLVVGAGGALGPAIQTRLMDVAGDSQTLAAAANHSGLNIGNSLGAALGGAVIAAGLGFVAPVWVGALLVVPGALLALWGWALDRRSGRRDGPRTGSVPVPEAAA